MIKSPIPVLRIENTRASIERAADRCMLFAMALKKPVTVKCTPSGAIYLDDPSRDSVPELIVATIDTTDKRRAYRAHHLEEDIIEHALAAGVFHELRTKRPKLGVRQ